VTFCDTGDNHNLQQAAVISSAGVSAQQCTIVDFVCVWLFYCWLKNLYFSALLLLAEQ